MPQTKLGHIWLFPSSFAGSSTFVPARTSPQHGQPLVLWLASPVSVACVLQMVAQIAPLAAAYQIPDAVMGTVQGVLRGMGRQHSLVWVGLIAFWVVGVPIQYLLTFQARLGLPGLWMGILSGVVVAGKNPSCHFLCLFNYSFFAARSIAADAWY